MKHRSIPGLSLIAMVCCLVSPLGAQDQVLNKYVISAGGNEAAGGDFVLRSSTAQVTTQTSLGRGFTLISGFWVPESAAETTELLFWDGFETPNSN